MTLIAVEYELLPTLDEPEAALRADAPKLHPGGNVLHRTAYNRGNAADAFAGCAYITENTGHLLPERTSRLPSPCRYASGAAFYVATIGCAFSYGAPDYAGGRLRLNQQGRIEASFSKKNSGRACWLPCS